MGIEYIVGKFLFVVNFCVWVNDDFEGVVKFFIDKVIGKIFGAYIVFGGVGEFFVECVFVMEYGVMVEDIVCMCYLYLMVFEVVKEVAMVATSGMGFIYF